MLKETPHDDVAAGSLSTRRERMQLSVGDVAGRLLLSKRLVLALEAADPSAFYNESFYRQALARYRALLALNAPEQGLIPPTSEPAQSSAKSIPFLAEPVEPTSMRVAPAVATRPAEMWDPAPAPKQGTTASANKASSTGLQRSLASLLSITLAVAAIGVLMIAAPEQIAQLTGERPLRQGSLPEPREAPASVYPADTPMPPATEPAPGSALTDAPDLAVPATGTSAPQTPAAKPQRPTATTVAPSATGFGLEATALCWVFARDASGKETEATLRPGQKLVLPAHLTYLAIGDISALRVLVDGQERDLARLSKDGKVVRLRQSDLEMLRPSRDAYSASEPAPTLR
jgi:hypothetical protein